MAGKRNINRLRRIWAKEKSQKTVKKTADTVRRTAKNAAATTAIRRAAKTVNAYGQRVERKYAPNSGRRNYRNSVTSDNNGYIKNSRLAESEKRRQERQKKEIEKRMGTSFVDRMDKYNRKSNQLGKYGGLDRPLKHDNKPTVKSVENEKKKPKENGGVSFSKRVEGYQPKNVPSSRGSTRSDFRRDLKDGEYESWNKIKSVTKGNVRQNAGEILKALSSGLGKNAEYSPAALLMGDKYKGSMLEKSHKFVEKKGKKLSKYSSKQIDKGQKEIDEGTKDLGTAGKFFADLYGVGIDMGMDALTGPAAPVTMFTRAYGSAYNTAGKEGASDQQASLYAASIGGLEAATEKMFAVAKPLNKLYGKGVGDKLTNKVLDKIIGKVSSEDGKNAVHHGGKTFLSALSEGLEEMVSEGLEPTIANVIYAKAVGTPHSTSWGDIAYSGLLGATMGGLLGGAGEVSNYSQGKKVQNIYGEDGVKKLAKAAKEVDDTAMSARGAAINEMINQGEGIAAGQANEIYQAVRSQVEKDIRRYDVMNASSENVMRKDGLLSPIQVNMRTGEALIGKKTTQTYNEQKTLAQQKVNTLISENKEVQLTEEEADRITSSVAAVQTGIAGVDDVNMFTIGNPEARTIYTMVTGKELPDTNSKTREMLYNTIGVNRIEAARVETVNRVDEIKGLLGQDMSGYYESTGQEAFAEFFDNVDTENAVEVDETLRTFDDFYRAGRNDIAYDDVISYQNPIHEHFSEDVKKAAWEAGRQDRILATDTAKGLQMEIGKAAKKSRSQGNKKALGGRLYSEISRENRANLTASQQAMYRMLARTFNIDIHIVDNIENGANGYYKDGAVYLSMDADRAMEYVFAHEITHHMQKYAPEEYNTLKELVRTSWAKKGGMDEAIDRKMAQYAKEDVKISREDALDEIIADSTYEMLQDEEFINELCQSNRSVAQAILDAIKNVLKKLRLMMAAGDRFTPAQNENLLSNLDILKDFEKLWTDGLMKTVENKAAVGSVGNEVRQQAAKDIKSFNITREDVADNIIKVANMGPVAKMTGKEFAKGEKRLSEQVSDYYDMLGNVVHNNTIGYVELNYDTIMDDISHGVGRKKAISFMAVPDVVEKGEIIDTKLNRENREYDTVILAAPITIGDDGYVMGVIIRRIPSVAIRKGAPGAQKHYVHEVMIEKISADFKTGQANSPGAGVNTDSSIGSLLYDIIEVKNGTLQKDELLNRIAPDEGKFSLKEPVEETKELLVLHNINANNLSKTLKLGGFPMPSLAITKDSIGHTDFGEISIIFDKNTINPENEKNKVYSADAWTPTFPKVEYEIDRKKGDNVHARANEVGTVPFFNPVTLHPDNLENSITDGEKGLVEKYKNDYGLKQMYLSEVDNAIPMEMVQKKKYTSEDIELYDKLWDSLGDKLENNRDEVLNQVKEIYAKYKGESYDKVPTLMANITISNAIDYKKNGIYETVADEEATKRKIDEKADQGEYEKWLKDLFDGIIAKEGFWNGKDFFTESGDRRSFDSTHYPVSVENIVKAMLSQNDDVRNVAGFNGIKTVRAAVAKEFKSIEDIRNNKERLQDIETGKYDEKLENMSNRLFAVVSDIANKKGGEFSAYDSIGNALVEELKGKYTSDSIRKALNQYRWNVSKEQAQEIYDIAKEVEAMPVNMFEAKPQRVVGFDEIKAVVVPDNIDSDLRQAMDEVGMEVVEYAAENNEDRVAKVNDLAEMKNVKFSVKEDTDITYDSLVSKPDMKIVKISNESVKTKTRKDIVNLARENAEKNGHKDTLGRIEVLNNDTKNNIIIGAPSIRHGLVRDYEANGRIALHLGEYLKEAIKINEIESRTENSTGGYLLLGYGKKGQGEHYPAYFVIQTLKTGEKELIEFDSLYSFNGKKISEAVGGANQGVQSLTSDFKISISDLLDIVNEMYSDILPKSVAEHYGNERRKTKLGESVKYSLPDETAVVDYANEHETEFADLTGFRDYELKKKTVRSQTYGELLMLVDKLQRDKRYTHGKVLDEKSVKEEVNSLVSTLMTYSESYTPNGYKRKTNSKIVSDTTKMVSQIYTAMKKGDVLSVINIAENTAENLVQSIELVNDSAFYEYKDLRDYLRNTRMVISDEDSSSIADFRQFKKDNFGRLRIVKKNGMPVDMVYSELLERYPELLSGEATHPADQLKEIAEARESLEPYDIMLAAEETEQLVKQAAQDLIEIASLGKPWKSWADKKKEQYDERLKIVKARHKEALRDVRKNERERAERMVRAERQKSKERLAKVNERADRRVQEEKDKASKRRAKEKESRIRKEYMASIEKNRKWLADRLTKPTDDKHIPEGFRSAVAELLSQIDMQTKKSKNLETKRGERAKRWVEMDELRARLSEIAKEDGSGEFEYDGYIFEVIDSMAQHMDGKAVDEASTDQVHELDILMKYIVANVENYNKAFDESIKENISQLAEESIGRAKSRQEKLKDGKYYDRSGALGAADRLLNESMVTPRDFFERLGGGIEKAFMSMRRGMDKHVDNMAQTRDFFDNLFKPYRNKTAVRKRSKPGSAIEKWRDDSQVQTFTVQGGEITLSPAQIMSLYCLSKREQALGHIFGSGIVVSKVDKSSKLKKALSGKISTSGSTVMVNMEDVTKIIDTLTPEQIEMADRMQEYLNNECAAWGNEVSMRMYGYRKFTEENYFPIKSADAYLDSNFEGRQAAERIKNFGFIKGTVVNANNPIMIDDIFSVVADHVNKMSLYNAFAAPISDFTRVYNYKSRDSAGLIRGSVKGAVEDAYGKKAINYINNFMSDVNSQVQTRSEGLTRFVSKSLANYKKSAIGGNLRVALQQPTAVVRAFTLISPKYFMNTHINPIKNMRDMQEHCQIAKWKAWGFSQVDMARDIDDIMMNNEWSKIDAVTMEIYGALDNITWSSIWAAVREETKAKYKDVEVDSAEFYKICNERAAEIFDKTQVVDSVFHRSQAMRNTDVMSKMLTSFMAEPTRTFNMMRTEYARAIELWHEGNKAGAVGKFNRATSVFVLNAAAVSAAAAIADALRDKAPGDDDDDSWWTNFWANFWGNVNPLNMIPMVKDIWGYTDGWGTQNMAMEGWEKLVQGTMNLIENRDAESLKAFCEGLGYVTGLPIKNVIREVESIFKALGLDVFAAEDGSEEEGERVDILDSVFGKMHIKDGSNFDNVLNHFGFNLTEKEKAQQEYDERISDIKEKIKGLSGDDKQDKIWDEATENYTKYIDNGKFKQINEIRKLLSDLGGDVDKFDESVLSKVKGAYKKSIGEDGTLRGKYRDYLIEKGGMTENQISRDIVAKSDTAKEFKMALCVNDDETAIEALTKLREAGITYEDGYSLYLNRSKYIDLSEFSTGEMVCPVSGTITSPFGYRNQPTAGASSYHEAIDIGAPMGSEVAAADGGKITYAGWNGGYGYQVRVSHGNGRETWYSHLQEYYYQKGDVVKKGQIIAAVGSTGTSTGPHLDFKVKEGGHFVDPMIYL